MPKKGLPSPYKISHIKQQLFLKTLAITGKVTEASKAAGFSSSTSLYMKRKKDEKFAEAWDLALYAAGDKLEAEAIRRAHDGVYVAQYYQGEVVGHNIKYSDTLLMFMLKGIRPDKFRDNVSIDGHIKGTFGVAVLPVQAISDAAWENQALIQQNQHRAGVIIDQTEEETTLLGRA